MNKEQSLENLVHAARKLAKLPNIENRGSAWDDVRHATSEVIQAITKIDNIDWKSRGEPDR